MTGKQFKEHYLKILNGAATEDFEEKEKIFRTEIQAEQLQNAASGLMMMELLSE